MEIGSGNLGPMLFESTVHQAFGSGPKSFVADKARDNRDQQEGGCNNRCNLGDQGESMLSEGGEESHGFITFPVKIVFKPSAIKGQRRSVK